LLQLGLRPHHAVNATPAQTRHQRHHANRHQKLDQRKATQMFWEVH
jgi:hypothetical protein